MRQAITNLNEVLREAGGDLTTVIKTTCFLTDIADFAKFDAVYEEFFPEPRPARSTFGVALAGDLLFEIEVVARLGGDDE